MSPFLLIAVLIGGGLLAFGKSSGASSNASKPSSANPLVYYANSWDLPDIDSANQSGGFDTSYDNSFEKASGATGVPFALLKAHAIRESLLKPTAYHFDNDTVGASYGLMQVEWINGSNRFDKYGFTDSQIGDGSLLYDPDTNTLIGAYIIRDNLNWLKGSLRDSINAYNTGTRESKTPAPHNYVNDVLAYYNQILGEGVVA